MEKYIDKEYYRDSFLGVEVEDDDELDRMIMRATDVIDQLTNYKIADKDQEKIPAFVLKQVKKATAAQVEFFELEGGAEIATTGGQVEEAQIGRFRYGGSGSETTASQRYGISQATIEHLKPTGLLYKGIDTAGAYYV